MKRPKLLFLVTEDWFFRSHFLPLAQAAIGMGFDVVVAARDSGALADVAGVRLAPTPFSRNRAWDIGTQAVALRALLRRERPDIVHAIALKSITLLLSAGVCDFGRVLAITGRGYFALGTTPVRWAAGGVAGHLLRRALDEPRTVLLVENQADADWAAAGRALRADQVVLMPGAGVDAEAFAPAPEPEGDELVVGVVGRLIQSKGIGLAVEAVRRLRAEGVAIALRIAGDVDPDNPNRVSAAEIAAWRATAGVALTGRITDVNGFWARTHMACLPSLGGEGLPKALLEAAACGRAIVTSDAPGCADFVRHEATGLVVPRGDVGALTAALRRLALSAAERKAMGAAGRARILEGFTEAHAQAQARTAWAAAGGAPREAHADAPR